ncbi:MAG: hypothetical protein ACK4J0_00110 [Candidatus Anstonellaceae archaeon]
MKKGQYFSADIVVAIIIFIFSLSILLNYWHGLKSQGGEGFLYSEALRISDLLLSPGDYNVSGKSIISSGSMKWVNWYDDPDNAIRAGLGVEGMKNKIIYSPKSAQLGSNYPSFDNPKLKIFSSSSDPDYKKLKALFGTYLDFYVEFNFYSPSSLITTVPPTFTKQFGLNFDPTKQNQIAKVRRAVYIYYSFGPVKTPQYIGYMDIYVWQNKQ